MQTLSPAANPHISSAADYSSQGRNVRREHRAAVDFLTGDDVVIVGYGLDDDNRYRELPCIADVEFTGE
jgi:hypoxanthine-guanine phosphoribosyltransferase